MGTHYWPEQRRTGRCEANTGICCILEVERILFNTRRRFSTRCCIWDSRGENQNTSGGNWVNLSAETQKWIKTPVMSNFWGLIEVHQVCWQWFENFPNQYINCRKYLPSSCSLNIKLIKMEYNWITYATMELVKFGMKNHSVQILNKLLSHIVGITIDIVSAGLWVATMLISFLVTNSSSILAKAKGL